MQDEWSRWSDAEARRREALPTPLAAEMLSAVLLAVASEIGRAQPGVGVTDALVAQVRARVAGR